MKKKKVYCKRCRWRNSEIECQVWGRVDNHDSPKSKVQIQGFDTTVQNKNNDCAWYQFSFWNLIP